MDYLFKILIVVFLFGFETLAQAQNTIPAAGGDALGSGGTVSYSVGQVFYTIDTSAAEGSVARGVQQAFGISVNTAIEKSEYITLVCSAYPNPVSDFLTLKVEDENRKSLYYKLFDENGRLLKYKKVTDFETRISFENLNPAVYFLSVTDNNKEIKTFKIIKH